MPWLLTRSLGDLNQLAPPLLNYATPPDGSWSQTVPVGQDPVARYLAPAPDTEYGSVLPIARDTTTGELRPQ
jgi:hypothetical protein